MLTPIGWEPAAGFTQVKDAHQVTYIHTQMLALEHSQCAGYSACRLQVRLKWERLCSPCKGIAPHLIRSSLLRDQCLAVADSPIASTSCVPVVSEPCDSTNLRHQWEFGSRKWETLPVGYRGVQSKQGQSWLTLQAQSLVACPNINRSGSDQKWLHDANGFLFTTTSETWDLGKGSARAGSGAQCVSLHAAPSAPVCTAGPSSFKLQLDLLQASVLPIRAEECDAQDAQGQSGLVDPSSKLSMTVNIQVFTNCSQGVGQCLKHAVETLARVVPTRYIFSALTFKFSVPLMYHVCCQLGSYSGIQLPKATPQHEQILSFDLGSYKRISAIKIWKPRDASTHSIRKFTVAATGDTFEASRRPSVGIGKSGDITFLATSPYATRSRPLLQPRASWVTGEEFVLSRSVTIRFLVLRIRSNYGGDTTVLHDIRVKDGAACDRVKWIVERTDRSDCEMTPAVPNTRCSSSCTPRTTPDAPIRSGNSVLAHCTITLRLVRVNIVANACYLLPVLTYCALRCGLDQEENRQAGTCRRGPLSCSVCKT